MRTLTQITEARKAANQKNPFSEPYSTTLIYRYNTDVVGKNMLEVAENLARKEWTEAELIHECCELYPSTESREELYVLVLFKKVILKNMEVRVAA